jgi:hypothetical protein
MLYLSAKSGETPSWGRFVGLLVGLGLFLLLVRIHRGLVASGRLKPRSPTGRGSKGQRVKPQVTAGSGSGDPSSAPVPEGEVAQYEWGSVSGAGDRRVEVTIKRPGEKGEGLEAWIADRLGWRPRDIIAGARAQWSVSESTVKRALRRVRKAGRTP